MRSRSYVPSERRGSISPDPIVPFHEIATPSGRSAPVPFMDVVPPAGIRRAPRVSTWLKFRQGWIFGALERLAAGVLLLALAPIIALVYIVVRLTSRGPGLYWQTRTGRDNAVFDLIKFRSMYIDAESRTGPTWCTTNDARITPFGRFLRRSHLDEFPQLWNVLCGHMSFIGPRPERPHFVENICERYPHYQLRHEVKPGITGFAQVHFRAEQAIEDSFIKVSSDLMYLDRSSPLFDIKILLATVVPGLFKKWLARKIPRPARTGAKTPRKKDDSRRRRSTVVL